MKKKVEIVDIIFWILVFLPIAITLVLLPLLPDQIPAHYSNGIADKWGSKYETLITAFALPACLVLLRLLIKRISNNEKYEQNRRVIL